MNKKILFLLLGASCAVFSNSHKSLASGSSWNYNTDNLPDDLRRALNQIYANSTTSRINFDMGYPIPSRKTNPAPQSNAALAAQAVAIACKKPTEDFFGFDPRYVESTADFQREMSNLQRTGGSDDLIKDWISQPNAAVKLTGFLNSFGETLATADAEEVEKTLRSGQSVNPKNLLDKAYNDMARLISGQVVQIDEKRTATKEEERVLLQAAANLGRKKAAELEALRREWNFENILLNALMGDYNLLNPRVLNRTTLRHNLILLDISFCSAMGEGMDVDWSAFGSLTGKGISYALLNEVRTYRRYANENFFNPSGNENRMPNLGGYYGYSFTNHPPVRAIRPSHHIADIVSGKFESYSHDTSPAKVAKRNLSGIELLGMDPSLVQERLAPFGKAAFDALKNPRNFISVIRAESQRYTFSGVKRGYLEEIIEWCRTCSFQPQYHR